jgi:hypothetical protein
MAVVSGLIPLIYNIAASVLDLHAPDCPNTDAYLKLKNHNT